MAFLFPPPKKKTPRIIAIPNPSDAILDPIYYCLPEWVPLAVLRPSTSDPSLNPTPLLATWLFGHNYEMNLWPSAVPILPLLCTVVISSQILPEMFLFLGKTLYKYQAK